jgi:hypothetical protein
MITNLAAAAPSCSSTGTWGQRWKCGWNAPVSPAVAHAGYDFSHGLLPALLILAAVILIAKSMSKRKKARAAPDGAAARR